MDARTHIHDPVAHATIAIENKNKNNT